MVKRLLNMFLLIIAMLSIVVIIISPTLLFTSGKLRQIRMSFAEQKVAPQRLFINAWRSIKILYIDPTMNQQDWNRWKKRYLKKIKTNDDVVVAVNTMLASLNDKNSEFFNRNKFQLQSNYIKDNTDDSLDFKIDLFGNLFNKDKEATKILLTTIAGSISKAEVIKGSKTYKDPQKNDEIIYIDGYPLFGMEMNAAIKLIKGKNSTQRLTIIRNGKLITRTTLKGSMDVDKMSSRLLPENILVINAFTLMGSSAVGSFIDFMNSNPDVKGIIIDLRGNVGGLFPNAISIADIFIENGIIATIKYRNNTQLTITAQVPYDIPEKPIVILVDKKTASACEILAGALKYNNKAFLVGTNTFGKSSVQQVVPMQNSMGMNITTAKYLLNGNIDINNEGIKPDYIVNLTSEDILKNNDKPLKKAIEIIEKEYAQKNAKN